MLAVESVVGELFIAILLATSETTTAKTPVTCAISDSLAPCCFTDVQPIEPAAPSSTAKSCSAMPSDCSAADLVPVSDFSCVDARSDPGTSCAPDCVSLENELAARSWTCRPACRKVNPRCNFRVFRLCVWRARVGIGSALVFALICESAPDSWTIGCLACLMFQFFLVLAHDRWSHDTFALLATCVPNPVARCAVNGFRLP